MCCTVKPIPYHRLRRDTSEAEDDSCLSATDIFQLLKRTYIPGRHQNENHKDLIAIAKMVAKKGEQF